MDGAGGSEGRGLFISKPYPYLLALSTRLYARIVNQCVCHTERQQRVYGCLSESHTSTTDYSTNTT